MKIRLRLVYADGDAAATLLRFVHVSFLYKSEIQVIYVQLNINDRRNQVAMLQHIIIHHSLNVG